MQVLLWIDCVYPNTYVYVHASAYMQVLLWIDRAFTCAFALELAVNLYANFFWDFVTDGWLHEGCHMDLCADRACKSTGGHA